MVIRAVCPQCQSPKFKKNGHIHNGKQNHHCHDCGRQFVQCFEQYLISEDKRGLIERLLLERISLRGICRAVGGTRKWLLGFLVQCFEALPDHLHVQPVSCTHDVLIQRLEVEADEMASFVQKKAHKQWIWIAMDAKTRQIIAFHVGDRSHTSAEHLSVGQDSPSVPSARYLLHRSICRGCEGDSCGATQSDQQVGAQNESHRTFQQYAEATRVTAGPRRVILFQEARQPYRGHEALHLPLQPDESGGIERALHGVHYPRGCPS